ncbi:5-methyltetrahydrofolate--homocysteine methyltransferase [Helicobacter pylori]|uniref:HNH endonuclease n=1 Tax=Helicobacter pylori TaxID=210 RepID=UPI0019249017|nr:HNH endonuclease [Helicobacter pylori]QQW87345.1 5-methyltetrahydrofolate--homocysteine methyltransferase [Helicobacter pylori]
MAEWKTDTEEVKQIVKRCRDFKGSLQEEKCAQFIKNLDKYAREILVERRKIELQLQGAIEELRKAKRNEEGARFVLRGLQVGSLLSFIFPPARVAATAAIAAAEMVLKFMEEDTRKCKRNVELLQQALETYSTQARASKELVEGAWESVKKALNFYTDKHQEFIKRLNYASEAIDNQYHIAPPEILNESDFESPTIVYNPKKSVFDERLKDLREDFSFSLYADLKDRINANLDRTKASKEQELDLMSGAYSFDESLNLAKKNYAKNFKEALKDFTEKIKESPNDLNAMNEAFNHLKTELERVSADERLKGFGENLASLYADLKDKIDRNALSDDELDRIIAFREQEVEKNLEDLMPSFRGGTNSSEELERMASFRGQEFEKNLEDLMPSSLGVPSYDESLNLAKKHCVKNCKKALEDFTEKIKESPNDLNAMNEAFNSLETELERATENFSQKTVCVLERYENYKQQALGYGEFLEKEKEGFIVDEQNPYPEEIRFNELRLAEFDSVFSAIVPLEDLDKPACAHHALKALEAALKNRDLGFDATELEQIAKGFIPRGYLWHFDANVLGNLALVREELLLGVKHTKGYLLWKQFLQTQN